MITKQDLVEILNRQQRGEGQKKIAKCMGLTRKTVKKYFRMSPEQVKEFQERKEHDRAHKDCFLDAYKDKVEDAFWRAEGNCVNVQEILEEEEHLSCSLRTLQWYCKKKEFRKAWLDYLDEQAKHGQYIETPPGDEVQIDFGEKVVLLGGVPTRVHFFVGVLGYSRRMYAQFFTFENQEAWLTGLENLFFYMGCVPRKVICDNARSLVYQPRGRHDQAIYTEGFRAFCHYWDITPVACHAYTPQEKGKVENGVRYLKISFLKDFRVFYSIEDMQEKFQIWELGKASIRDFPNKFGPKFKPIDRFNIEFKLMRPVSQARIAEYRQEKRKVSASSCISVDNQLYRIPGDLGNSTVDVLIGKEKLIVFHEGKTVTTLNKTADALRPMLRPEEKTGGEKTPTAATAAAATAATETGTATATSPKSLPPSVLDRPISDYKEVAK